MISLLMKPIIFALIPLFFLPFTQDFYDTNKLALLIISSFFLLLAAAWRFVQTSRLPFFFDPTTIGLATITTASFVSLFFASTNRIEALLDPFGPATFASLTLISLVSATFWTPTITRRFLWFLFGTTFLLGLIAVYQFAGIAKIMFPDIAFLTNPFWTPTGSIVATTILFILALPLLFQGIFEGRTHKKDTHVAILILMTIVVLAGLTTTLIQLIPRISTLLLSPAEGWAILLEILKTPSQALAGVGAENFLTAFTAGRPVRLNLTPLWTSRFTISSNLLFHMTTINGLAGLTGLVIFIKTVVSRRPKNAIFVSLLIGVVGMLLTPPNLSLLVVISGLAIFTQTHKLSPAPPVVASIWIKGAVFMMSLLVSSVVFYQLSRSYGGEIYYAQAKTAIQNKDGTAAYHLLIKSIDKNPSSTRTHITFSQTNLALAVSLAREDQVQNRTLISQLIQQAITEGKLAVAGNTQSILAWENLSRTYSQLIGTVLDADTWAIAAYTQAIALDPHNPLLALELGGVYVQKKNYTDAITQFMRATNLKGDYANAWYNLANVYDLSGDRQMARKTLEATRTLLDPTSTDYQIITEELRGGQTSQDSSLSLPSPIPVVEPPLDIQN